MKTYRTRSLVALAALGLLVLASPAAAQKKPAAKAGPVDGKTAYEKAKAAALKWKPDAELFDFGSMGTTPLDSEGRSPEWYAKWKSKSAGKVNLMNVKNGVVEPFETAGGGGRTIPVVAETTFDTKKLLQQADGAGGAAYRAKGAKVSAGLVDSRGGTLWHLSYSGPDGLEVFHVGIEGETGKLTVLSSK